MRLSKIEKIKWKRGEEWFDTWGDTELAFSVFHSNKNPLLAVFHKGGLDNLALNTIWYYSDWASWGQDKDYAAGNEIILQKLVSEEEKYLKKVKEVIAQTKRKRNINYELLKKVKYVFLLMHYIFVTDLGGHLSPAIHKRLKNLALTEEKIEEIKDYFLIQNTLFSPQKEERDLRKIAKLFKSIHGKTIPKSFNQLNQEFKRLLIRHQRKYSWVQYSGIDTEPYTLMEMFNRLRELLNNLKLPQNLRDRQKNTISNKLSDLADKDIGYFRLVKRYIYLDNLAADLYQYLFFLIVTLIKQKFEISYKDITWYSFQELEQLIKDNIKISKAQLHIRKNRVMVQIDEKIDFFYGRGLFKKIEAIIPKKLYKKIRSITGNVACRGVATGKVTIIKGIKDVGKMKRGNILVSPNTYPDLVMTMRKAAAIVTDWGGVTSHAAIVSREFGIPCIVGTSIATQILKDDDEVEVDANIGIVRILKKRELAKSKN